MRDLEIADLQDRPQAIRRWLTTGEAARILRLSARQVIRLIDEGRLRCLDRTASGLRLFPCAMVIAFADQRTREAAQSRARRLAAIRPRMLQAHDPRQGNLRLF